MNILFTTVCNRSCSYCFAKGKFITAKNLRASYMSFKDLKIIINFLKKSKQTRVGIIGGEPTLHPRFKEAITMILDKRFQVLIFSNGIIKKDTVKFLERTDKNRCRMLLNINAPNSYTKKEWLIINRTVRTLNKQVDLGFNIYRIDFNMDFLIDLIKKYRLERYIRIGIAHPLWGQNNEYIPLESHRKIAEKIIKFARKCDALDISLVFDCGFTLCIFTAEEIGQLFCYNSFLNSLCKPVIDVGPDLIVWNCFVTSMLWNKRLTDFKDLNEVNKFYINKFKSFRKVGAMNKCFRCKYLRRGQCCGGCLGHTLRSLDFENSSRLTKLFKEIGGEKCPENQSLNQ